MDPFEPDHGTGTYDLTFMVEQDAEDMVPSNNSRTASFSLSDNVYAHDDGNVDAYQTQGIDHVDEPFEVGNHYYMIADGVATGLQIALHPNTPVGSSIYGAIYIPSASAANHPTLVDLTDIHIVTSADLSEVGSANFITLSFRDPIALSADNTYLLVVGSSLKVYSGYRFCLRAREWGKPLALVNPGWTRADELASLKVMAPCAGVLETLLSRLAAATVPG